MEDYSIQSADTLLCPSHFLARQAATLYGLPLGSVEIIPYPLGNGRQIERVGDIWTKGSICYVGRLEKRKGILEWLSAAVAVAQEHRSIQFEFVGRNVVGSNRILSEQIVEQAIPRSVRGQFTFHGELPRAQVAAILARARIAVVPSRWDNFPNTCMEAMQSGLPVITTRQGGMAEMVADGQTGWLAEAATIADLRDALRRAVGTTPDRLAANVSVSPSANRTLVTVHELKRQRP